MSFDIAVVGGGIAGSAVAYRFAKRGLKVVLFDLETPGAATRAAGGILCAQIEAEGTSAFLDLLVDAEEAHRRLARELGSDRLGRREHGVLRIAFTETEFDELARVREHQLQRSLPVEAVDASNLRRLEPAISPEALGANLFPRGAQVDNREMLDVLRVDGAALGVELRHAHVTGIEVERDRATGVIAGETISAGTVVLAGGAWSAGLAGTGLAASAIRPVRGQMIALSNEGRPLLTRIVFGAGGYAVPRGNRVLIGSTMEDVGFDARNTEDALNVLEHRARKLCPALATAPRVDSWFGFRPATRDGLPAIGPTPIAGLHLAVGFLRNGILLAPLAAEWVVAAALGEPAPIPRAFAASRLLA